MITIFIGIGVQLKSVGTFTPTIGCRFHVPCRFRVLGIVALFVLFRTALLRLNHIDNVEKMMPRNFITKDGFGITLECRDYLQPLIAGEYYPPYKNGLPDYVRLKNRAVAKKLKTEFEI